MRKKKHKCCLKCGWIFNNLKLYAQSKLNPKLMCAYIYSKTDLKGAKAHNMILNRPKEHI